VKPALVLTFLFGTLMLTFSQLRRVGRIERDVRYARAGDKDLLLDLYLPLGSRALLPVIVWIHGGAWRSGDKARPPAVRLMHRGYAVASINYRLSQDAIFPAQIHDVKAAVRWLRAHASKYNLDAGRIGVWGASAGGHLAALLGTSGGVTELEGELGHAEQSSRVQAVVDFFGPTDFLAMNGFPGKMDHNAADSPESQLVGGPIREKREEVARANPITYVTADDPPFLILHGDQDMLVPLNQSELLAEALKKAGVAVTFEAIRGGGHGFAGREIDAAVDGFFDRHLRSEAGGARPGSGA
jgi:acetyl esterase/lipase